MSEQVRVRFAPSPTGELHIGGARTALFNYLYARSLGGVFVLRIDDTDLERSREEYTDKLLKTMQWLGLNWDEGPYQQSARLDIYREEAQRLLEQKRAYRCYCSIEELAAGREEARKENRTFLYPGTCRTLTEEEEASHRENGRLPVIRIATPHSGLTLVQDEIRGEISFDNRDLDDLIIMKSNGLPTYNFASIVDDLRMRITHVMRAEEHLSNTPRQQLCAEALGYKLPRFAHVPMILAPDRSKLSKRHGATSVEEFDREGFLPEALINYIALLGWSPGHDEEILTMEEMIARFSLDKVNKTAAVYDTGKLTWMNGHYIREYDSAALAEAALPFFAEAGLVQAPLDDEGKEYLRKVVHAVRERAKTLVELAEASTYFYRDHFEYDPKGVKKAFRKEDAAGLLRRIAEDLQTLQTFNRDSTEKQFELLSEKLALSAGRLIQPARLALTGRTGGPALFEIIELLGRKKTVDRLCRAAAYCESLSGRDGDD